MSSIFLFSFIVLTLALTAIFLVILHWGHALIYFVAMFWHRYYTGQLQPAWPALLPVVPSSLELVFHWSGYRRSRVLVWVLVAGFLVGVGAGIVSGWRVGIFIGGLVVAAIVALLITKAARQKKKCVRQLPDAVAALVETLSAGYALPQAVQFVATELPLPVSALFKTLARAHAWQMNFSTALRRATGQFNIPEWAMVAEVLVAQAELGGNIIPLLTEVAKTLRDRLTVEEEVTTLTAAGRLSGILVAVLVPVVLVLFWLLSPAYVSILFATALGRLLLGIALILEIIGFVWIRQLVTIVY